MMRSSQQWLCRSALRKISLAAPRSSATLLQWRKFVNIFKKSHSFAAISKLCGLQQPRVLRIRKHSTGCNDQTELQVTAAEESRDDLGHTQVRQRAGGRYRPLLSAD